MSGLLGLSRAARSAVVKALMPAEPIVYVTAPDPAEASRAVWPTAAAGGLLVLLGAPIAWLALDAAWRSFHVGEVPVLALCMAAVTVPGVVVGLYLMLAPHAAQRRARDTVILVTDRRLLTLSISGGPARTLPGRAIIGVERRKVERGYGTLEVRHEALDPRRGDTAETILTGIDDVMDAEAAIRRLSSERFAHLAEPVA